MTTKHTTRRVAALVLTGSALAFSGWACAADKVEVKLSGDHEVPAVKTSASGSGSFTINDDKTVSGSVTTTGIKGTAAHIHDGATGKNGPVAVPLQKDGDNKWTVAPGGKLTDAQYKEFKAGNLYVNVHSAEHKDGEIRGQLKP